MNNRSMTIASLALCCVLTAGVACALAGCSQGDSGVDAETNSNADANSSAGSSNDLSSDGITLDIDGMDLGYSNRDLDASYDEKAATYIVMDGDSITVKDAEGNPVPRGSNGGSSAATNAASVVVEGSTVTVTAEGTYVFSGQLSDGQVLVDATNETKVQLVLDGVDIHNETGPAIYVKQADKCFITLAAGSKNLLTDGANYELEEGSDEPYATLFSKDDLTLNGDGALEVRSAYRHAICSKDDLVFGGGTYVVTSVEDAIRGRDCVKVHDGDFVIDAGDAAVKSNNDEDGTRGFVVIDGGTFEVTAVGDAFHAETLLQINGGTIDVAMCEEGLEGWQVTVNGGDIHIVSTDDGINAAAPDTAAGVVSDTAAAGVSADGADSETAADASARAGANAGRGGFMPGGMMDGMQGGIPGGDMQGGIPGGGMQGGIPGGGNALMDGAHESCLVEINGGYVHVDAGGDGVDSNGYVSVTGGTLLVMGPAGGADGTFDYAYEATISGGTVLMVGPVGMTQSFTSGEQAFFMTNASGQAGQLVAITDEQGNVLVSMTATKSFNSVLASAPSMVADNAYVVVVGGSVDDANGDGFAQDGSVSGGARVEVVASTQGSGAFSGMGGAMPGGMEPDGMVPDGAGEAAPDRVMPDGFGGVAPGGAMPEGALPDGMEPDGAGAPGGSGRFGVMGN